MANKTGYIHLHFSGSLPVLSKIKYRIYINNTGIKSTIPIEGEIDKIVNKTVSFAYDDKKISISGMNVSYEIIIKSSGLSITQGVLRATSIREASMLNGNLIYIGSTRSATNSNKENKISIGITGKKYLLWKGGYKEISIGKMVTDIKFYEFNLTSECLDGYKCTVTVRASATVAVVDVSILFDASLGEGEVTFYQNYETHKTLDPTIFNGVFALGSIAGAFGQTAVAPMAMGATLGDASGPGFSSDIIAIEMGRGTSEVKSYTKKRCI